MVQINKITWYEVDIQHPHSMNYQVTHLITPMKCLKYSCLLAKSPLDKNIYNHILRVAIYQFNKVFFNLISYQMILNLDMLYMNMKDLVLWKKIYILNVIAYDNGFHLWNTNNLKKWWKPHCLPCCFWSYHILSFCWWHNNRGLLLIIPIDNTISQ